MKSSALNYLAKQPIARILAGLLGAEGPKHLREIAKDLGLSVSGTADMLRRLEEAGIVQSHREGKRRIFSPSISDEEREILEGFFAAAEEAFLRERAKRFSKTALQKFEWMDAAYADAQHFRECFVQSQKKKRQITTKGELS